MSRNFHKWMIFGSITVFVFLVGAVGQSAPTSVSSNLITTLAPPTQTKSKVEYSLSVYKPGEPVCAGMEYEIPVAIQTKLSSGGSLPDQYAAGITIEASSSEPSVGTVSPAKQRTGMLATLVGDTFITQPDQVTFKFKANKPGTTNIFFEAVVKKTLEGFAPSADHGYFSKTITVKVVRCRYQIYTVSNWAFNAENLVSVMTASTTGDLKADAQNQDHMEGEAEANWSGFSFSEQCDHSHTFDPSAADYIGDVKSEVLKLRLNFEDVPFSSVSCASSNSGEFQLTGIDLAVPIKGGIFKQDTPLKWGNESMQGWTIIAIYMLANQ